MPERRQKTLHYRCAQWLHAGQTLESCTRQMIQALPNAEDRVVERGEDHFVRCINKRRRQAGGVFLHFTSDIPGEAATTVPKNLGHPDVDVGEAAPPQDSEFMKGDAFLFIRDDHLCFCAGAMRDGGIQIVLASLFDKSGLGDNATMFTLAKVADANKLAIIEASGVKEIILNASLFRACTHYAGRQGQPMNMLRSLGRLLYALRDDDEGDRDDNLLVRITIGADGRIRHNEALGYERLQDIASQIIENEEEGDSYTIVTKDEQKITPGKIILQKPMSLPISGNTVARDPTWNELLAYFQELTANHLIDA